MWTSSYWGTYWTASYWSGAGVTAAPSSSVPTGVTVFAVSVPVFLEDES